MVFDGVTANLNSNMARFLDVQEQLSSGKEINKPSDNPIQLSAVLALKTKIQEVQRFKANAQEVKSRLEAVDSTLGNISDIISRIKVLAIQSVNSAVSNSERVSMATEVDELIQNMVDNANTNFGQKYIFAGGETLTKPFTVTKDTNGRVISVQYHGDSGVQNVEIGAGITVAVNTPGSVIFDVSIATTGPQISRLFDKLIGFRIDLESSNLAEISSTRMSELTNLINHTIDYRAEMGARGRRVETTIQELEDTEVNLMQIKSEKEDINLAETIMKLQFAETAYQAALISGAKVMQPSLAQFLR